MRIPDTSYFPGRTNFWGSVLDPMFPYQEFIRMAGLLAKAHRDKPDAFTRFHKAMLDATDLEETPEPSSYGYKTRDSAEEPAYPGFGHFPNLLTAALARDPQNPEQIERARRFHERGDNFRLMMGVQLSHLAEQLFPKTERDLMDAAYHGKLLS